MAHSLIAGAVVVFVAFGVLTISFELPDLRVVTVTFAGTPDGTPELTGWEFTEE